MIGQEPKARLVAAGILAALAGVLVWNVFHYPWVRSYDAAASSQYAQVLVHEHRLPRVTETDVWHNPPLFYGMAGVLQSVGDRLGIDPPQRGVQVFDAACVLLIALLTYALARELLPDRPGTALLALALAATTPVLVRAGSLYHPEPLATALAFGGLYVVTRALRRDQLGWRVGALAGLLLGLGNLTRTWALTVLAATVLGLALYWLRRRERATVAAIAALGAVVAVLVIPWFAYQAAAHGSPLAYSRPNPEEWRQHGRPWSFWVGLEVDELVDRPYQPAFRNRLFPVVYADWWGDYWRSYDVPAALHDEPAVLPASYARPLRIQVSVGVVVALASLCGLVVLGIRTVRRREEATATPLLALGLLGVSFVGFLVRYPKLDGDNIKALYVLNAAPVLAIAAAVAFAALARRSRLWLLAVALALLVVFVSTVTFVVLPA